MNYGTKDGEIHVTPELHAALYDPLFDLNERTTKHQVQRALDLIEPIIDAAIADQVRQSIIDAGPGIARDALGAAADDLDQLRRNDPWNADVASAACARWLRARAGEGTRSVPNREPQPGMED